MRGLPAGAPPGGGGARGWGGAGNARESWKGTRGETRRKISKQDARRKKTGEDFWQKNLAKNRLADARQSVLDVVN